MSFSKLYEAVQAQQTQQGRISTKWLKEQAIALSDIVLVKEQWSGVMDPTTLRGFYIEGPLGPPVPLQEHEALIVLSRDMCRGHLGAHWRRFVFTKELMHVFDRPEEKADTPEKFDVQIEKFGDPTVQESPQFRAEVRAYWRALAVLCPEKERLGYRAELEASTMSIDVIASALHIPAQHARSLLHDNFPTIVQHMLEEG